MTITHQFESVEHAGRVIDEAMAQLLAIAQGTMPDGSSAPPEARRMAVSGWFALREHFKADLPAMAETLARAAYGIDRAGKPYQEYPQEQTDARRSLIDRGLASPLDFDRLAFDAFLAMLLATLADLGFPGPGRVG